MRIINLLNIYLRELVRGQNIELIWSVNRAEAVEKFRSDTDFDIVLMDLKMPVMDGYEATRIIKSINPGIPVIAISAFALLEDMEMKSDTCSDRYIMKPVGKNDLLIKIIHTINLQELYAD